MKTAKIAKVDTPKFKNITSGKIIIGVYDKNTQILIATFLYVEQNANRISLESFYKACFKFAKFYGLNFLDCDFFVDFKRTKQIEKIDLDYIAI